MVDRSAQTVNDGQQHIGCDEAPLTFVARSEPTIEHESAAHHVARISIMSWESHDGTSRFVDLWKQQLTLLKQGFSSHTPVSTTTRYVPLIHSKAVTV